jgi:hypothetical protein
MTASEAHSSRPVILELDAIKVVEALTINDIRADLDTHPLIQTEKGAVQPDILSTNNNLAFEGCTAARPEQFFARSSMDGKRVFTVYVDQAAQAFIELDIEDNAITEVYTLGNPFSDRHPHYMVIHDSLYCLVNRLEADAIPLDPIRYHLDYKMMRDGTRADTTPENAFLALYGTVVVPAHATLRDLHLLGEEKFLTLDISNVPQETLDGLRRVHGSLYSNQTQVVLRQLRHVGNSLILPNATCVATPYLCEIEGGLHAPTATFLHMPMLNRVYADMTLSALQYADFPNLGAVGGDISMPLFKFGAFPILMRVAGHISTPEAVQLYAPYLNEPDFKPCIAAAVHQLTNQIKNEKLENEAA